MVKSKLVFFFLLWNFIWGFLWFYFIFQKSNVLFIRQFQWLISSEGSSHKTLHIMCGKDCNLAATPFGAHLRYSKWWTEQLWQKNVRFPNYIVFHVFPIWCKTKFHLYASWSKFTAICSVMLCTHAAPSFKRHHCTP